LIENLKNGTAAISRYRLSGIWFSKQQAALERSLLLLTEKERSLSLLVGRKRFNVDQKKDFSVSWKGEPKA
jgi:hypothetical protein